jgi:hypothetical protein
MNRAPKARRGAAPILFAALLASSCAHPLKLITLPSGSGTAAPDATQALASATAACRAVSTIKADIGVSGSVGGRGVPHAHLIVGVAAPASARIEATVPLGGSAFIFTASGGEATLLLPRDNRVLEHGRPDAVLEALTGVPLTAEKLRAVLTGCAGSPDVRQAQHRGDNWIVIPDGDGELYLARDRSAAWQLAAETRAEGSPSAWRAEYHDVHDGLPRSILLSAVDRGRFELSLSLSDVELNTPIDPAAFTVKIPASAVPMTLDELRGAGPLQ